MTRIAAARPGSTVTVEGVVTTQAGLLDSDARRVTIQDGSGAILLRLPDGAAVPRVGARLRATGDVATYYGARQLEATELPTQIGQGRALPVLLRRAPGASDEWRLIRVVVRIVNVSRSGDTWRAEASLGAAGALPIVGLADSGIPSTALEEGRGATITGIVKRAYPTASDQRFAVVPRDASDIVLGPAPDAGRTSDPDQGTDPDASTPPGHGEVGDVGGDDSGGAATPDPLTGRVPGDPAAGTPVDARLAAVPGLGGRVVRVAGALRASDGPLLTLDDGSSTALARLVEPAPAFEPPLALGEVLNVTGLVSARDVGGWEIVVRAEDVVRAASLSGGMPAPTDASGGGALTSAPSPSSSPEAPADEGSLASGADPGRLALALAAGGLVAAVVIVVALLLLRRAPRTPRATGGSAASPAPAGPGGPPSVAEHDDPA